jgi:hypothetical protein
MIQLRTDQVEALHDCYSTLLGARAQISLQNEEILFKRTQKRQNLQKVTSLEQFQQTASHFTRELERFSTPQSADGRKWKLGAQHAKKCKNGFLL